MALSALLRGNMVERHLYVSNTTISIIRQNIVENKRNGKIAKIGKNNQQFENREKQRKVKIKANVYNLDEIFTVRHFSETVRRKYENRVILDRQSFFERKTLNNLG